MVRKETKMSVTKRLARGLPALAIMLAACGLPNQQSSSNGPVSTSRLVAISKPATVMVLADFKAHVTIADWKLDKGELASLFARADALVESGQLADNDSAYFGWVVNQILASP